VELALIFRPKGTTPRGRTDEACCGSPVGTKLGPMVAWFAAQIDPAIVFVTPSERGCVQRRAWTAATATKFRNPASGRNYKEALVARPA
jgi:hypothetical protein